MSDPELNISDGTNWVEFSARDAADPAWGRVAKGFLRTVTREVVNTAAPAMRPQPPNASGSVPQTVLDMGLFLRERDFLHLGIESWGWRNNKDPNKPRVVVGCYPFEGEIPCLYSICKFQTGGAPWLEHLEIGPQLLAVVDVVSFATGSGVGIVLNSQPNRPVSSIRLDPRTGRRMRYKITPYPALPSRRPAIHWIERSETGRGRGRGSHGAVPIF